MKLILAALVLLLTLISAQAQDPFCGQTNTPCWTTGTRPSPVGAGTFGYNTTTNALNFYDGTNWQSFGQSADSLGGLNFTGSPTGPPPTTHGCLAAATCYGYNYFQISSSQTPSTSTLWYAFDVETTMTAGFTGDANGLVSQFSVHGTPGDTNRTYVAISSQSFGQAPGGNGSLFGAGFQALLDASSTNWNAVNGGEIDVSCISCVVQHKTGLKIATEALDNTSAVIDNIGLSFTSNSSSSFWDCTLCFGGYAGTWTGDARTTLVGAWANGHARVGSGSAVPLFNAGTAANGVDFRNVTFTGFAFASNQFSVNATGTVTATFVSPLKAVVHQPLTFSGLTTGVGLAGSVSYITDGKNTNCGDTTCTTFGTAVTAGGGALPLLLWYNGTNWTLIGK